MRDEDTGRGYSKEIKVRLSSHEFCTAAFHVWDETESLKGECILQTDRGQHITNIYLSSC